MAKILIPAIAGGCTLALVAAAGFASATQTSDVSLTVDGETYQISVREDSVAEVLAREGIELTEHDVVLPGPHTSITDDMEITVLLGRPVEVTVDGVTRSIWTTASNVEQALGFLNLDEADSKISASRSTPIGREGLSLEIATAKDVTLTVAGEPSQLTIAGTVQDVLDYAEITPDGDDILTPSVETVLEDGLEITFVDVEIKSVEKEVEIPFEKRETTSSQMDKGTSRVTTTGVVGEKVETWTEVYHDGELESSELADSVVTKEPVHQVTTVGTREPAPAPTSTSSSGSSSSSSSSDSGSGDSSSSSSSSGSSSGLDLSRASMWDQIARCESTSRWNINTGNGYYGGLQFNLATWRSVNGQDFAAYPHQASREEQITVANRLYAKRGLQPWSCARVVR